MTDDMNFDDFGGDMFAPTPGPASRRRSYGFPWTRVAAIAGGVILLAAIVVGVVMLVQGGFDPPDRVVRDYYAALQAQDFERLGQLMDPDDLINQSILPNQDMVQAQIDKMVPQLPFDLNLEFQFERLKFTVVSRDGPSARVRVQGTIRVRESTTGLSVGLPLNWTHVVVKKDGHWYMKAW